MRRIVLSLSTALVMLATSCTMTVKTADSLSVASTVNNYPVVADLQIGKKVTETIEWNNTPIKKTPLGIGKGNLVSETISKNGGDILVEPQFIIETTGYPFFRHYKITVTGFIGNYKDFRNATDQDLKALETASQVPQGGMVQYNKTSGLKMFRK